MRRRTFNTLLGGAAAASPAGPSLVSAQQKTMPVIGILAGRGRPRPAFIEAMRELGYVEGKTVRYEYRSAVPTSGLPRAASELVDLQVDIIVASGTEATQAAQRATRTIPIVMAPSSDPVASGLVASLARPGANITGVSNYNTEVSAKRLELLKEFVGPVSRVAVLWKDDDPPAALQLRETEAAGRLLGIEVRAFSAREPEDFPAAFAAALDVRPQAVVILSAPVMISHVREIATWARENRLPSIFWERVFPEGGGLMSYGPRFASLIRSAALYADKILKGAKPADLPVAQPTEFELVINLTTAKALGLTIPPLILARASEVIE